MARRMLLLTWLVLVALPTPALATEYKVETWYDGHRAAADSVIVEFDANFMVADISRDLAAIGTPVRSYSLPDGTIVEAAQAAAFDLGWGDEVYIATVDVSPGKDLAAQIAQLRELSGVADVAPNYIHFPSWRPNDPFYSAHQLNFKQIYMENAWDIADGGGATVAVIDSGYRQSGLEDRVANLQTGYDFANNDNNVQDYEGHGTHVTNTVAERTNNGIGCAGIAFNASILPLKVFPDSGYGALEGDIISAINYARSHGADVINMSLGGGGYVSQTNSAINDAFNADVLVVCASGNDGYGAIDYPAAYSNAMAIGSCDTHAVGANPSRSDFSNYGTGLDLVAPGDYIVQETYDPSYGVDYYALGGTSMASPHVAAVAALLVDHGGAGAPEIRSALRSSARSQYSGWNSQIGYGEVDAYAALVAYGGAVNRAPNADAAANPRRGPKPLAVHFDGSGSNDPDGSIASYRWKNLSNGSVIGTTRQFDHTFRNVGSFTVQLTVTDNDGATATDTVAIIVDPAEGDDDDDDDDSTDDDDNDNDDNDTPDDDEPEFDDSECGVLLKAVYNKCDFTLAFSNAERIDADIVLDFCKENEQTDQWQCMLGCLDDERVDSCGDWRGCARQRCGVRVLIDKKPASDDGDDGDFFWGCG